MARLPSRLRCWRAGRENKYPFLSWINANAIVELRTAFDDVGMAAVRLSPVIHNQAGTAALWVLHHLRGEGGRDTGERSRDSMWTLARLHWRLTNLLAEVRH